MKKWTGILMAVAVLLSACACMAAEKEKTEFTIGVHFESWGGISSSQTFDMANSLLKVIAEHYGYTIKMKKYSSWHDVMRPFIENEIDAGWLGTGDVLEILDRGGEIYPLATYTVDKKRKMAVCLWERKDNALKNISDVAGKRILTNNNPLAFVLLRELLFENGMDRPLWKVFNSFILPAGGNSAFLALAMGDADFYWDSEDSKETIKLINPGLVPKVSYNFCTDRVYARGGIVLNKKTVKEADIKMLRTSLMEISANLNEYSKKEPGLKALKEYMKMAKVKFIPADPNEYDVELMLMRKAKENGWLEEAEFISQILKESPVGQPIKIRPGYKMCKEMCAGVKNQMDCLDECME